MTALTISPEVPVIEQVRLGMRLLNLNAETLGARTGTRPETLRRWLRGETAMSVAQFETLRDVLYAEADRLNVEFRFNV